MTAIVQEFVNKTFQVKIIKILKDFFALKNKINFKLSFNKFEFSEFKVFLIFLWMEIFLVRKLN